MGNKQADAGRDGRTRLARSNSHRRKRGQGNVIFPCSADHEQGWQPYPVDPYSAIWDDHTYTSTFFPCRCCCLLVFSFLSRSFSSLTPRAQSSPAMSCGSFGVMWIAATFHRRVYELTRAVLKKLEHAQKREPFRTLEDFGL